MYGRVNPLQGRLAGAWEDTERAAGRCWVVFRPREDQQMEALPGNLRDSEASETLLNPDGPQLTRRTAEVKAAVCNMFKINVTISKQDTLCMSDLTFSAYFS